MTKHIGVAWNVGLLHQFGFAPETVYLFFAPVLAHHLPSPSAVLLGQVGDFRNRKGPASAASATGSASTCITWPT